MAKLVTEGTDSILHSFENGTYTDCYGSLTDICYTSAILEDSICLPRVSRRYFKVRPPMPERKADTFLKSNFTLQIAVPKMTRFTCHIQSIY